MFSLLLALVLFQATTPPATANPAPQPAASSPAAAVPVEDPAVTALAKKIYSQMRAGKVDESLLSPEMNKAMTPEALTQQKPVFDQLGEPTKLTLEKSETLPQGRRYEYLAVFEAAQLHVRIFIDKDGKVAGYFLAP